MLVYIDNVCITTGQFPNTLKSAVVKPLLKKPTLDPHSMKNYRHVSNLPFLSKVIEKVIVKQLTAHMLNMIYLKSVNLLTALITLQRPDYSKSLMI